MYNYEQDYIMRIIQEIVRALMKLLFNIDSVGSPSCYLENEATQNQYNELIRLVDQQKINEAENKLYKILETDEKENLKLSLLFYDYVNNFDENYLREADYSRAEIELGIKTVAGMYGYEDFVSMFLFQPA